ncbi:hypothetical protein [Vibrio fluvialis]|uniref:hypothetical protein n=1 Tax=Vibrio fluvialis TaxID=676 RepID=UPI0023A98707|nr:hypothetical protein [Vibrio fluvialis]MDE5179197.1 hypothetical protein [Vibrio fluvialis]
MGQTFKSSMVDGYTVEFDPTNSFTAIAEKELIQLAGSVPSWITSDSETLFEQIARASGSELSLKSGDFKQDAQISVLDLKAWHPFAKLSIGSQEAFVYAHGVLTFYDKGEYLGYAILPVPQQVVDE